MKCLYCGKKLPMVKKLTSEEFCTVAHRHAYFVEQEKLAVERLMEEQQRRRPARKPLTRGKAAESAADPAYAGFLLEAVKPRRIPPRAWEYETQPLAAITSVLPEAQIRIERAKGGIAGPVLRRGAPAAGALDCSSAMAMLESGAIGVAVKLETPALADDLMRNGLPLEASQWLGALPCPPADPEIALGPHASDGQLRKPVTGFDPLEDILLGAELLENANTHLPYELAQCHRPCRPASALALAAYGPLPFEAKRIGVEISGSGELRLSEAATIEWEALPGAGKTQMELPGEFHPPVAQATWPSGSGGNRSWSPVVDAPDKLGDLVLPEAVQPNSVALPTMHHEFAIGIEELQPELSLRAPKLERLAGRVAVALRRPWVRQPRPPRLESCAAIEPAGGRILQPRHGVGSQGILARVAGKCAPFEQVLPYPQDFLFSVEMAPSESRFQFSEPIAPRGRIASVKRSTLGIQSKTYRTGKLQRLMVQPVGVGGKPVAHDWKPWEKKLIALPSTRMEVKGVKAGHSLLTGLSLFGGIGHQFGWESLKRRWHDTPNDLRWVAMAVPLVMSLLWFSSSKSAQAGLRAAVPDVKVWMQRSLGEDSLSNLKQSIQRRAAVELVDDFRQGLGEWSGSGDWSRGWSYDPAGFLRPRQLALYTPTLGLQDYRFEFLGAIERKALSWVFRAADVKNYYAARLEVTRGGPLPKVELVRWAVINGRPGPKKSVALPMQTRMDTIYRVRVDVRGSDFVTTVQGQVVDVFTDDRLPKGGVGFFSELGEDARLRWVEVSHQYDMLGRLCAYLVPYNLSNSNERSAP